MSNDLQNTATLKHGETVDQRLAEMIVSPSSRAAFLHYTLARKLFGPRDGSPDQRASFDGTVAAVEKQQEAARSGDMSRASDLLVSQAHVLDALFGDFMHRALENAGDYPEAMQRYMNLALKAQAQSRTAIEALARIHQPREQVVRHVHVNEGGQAIVADKITIKRTGGGDASLADQSHTAACSVGECASLLGTDPLGNSMRIPSREGPEAVPYARRNKSRRASRKRQCP